MPQQACSGGLIGTLVCDGIQGFLLPTAILARNIASIGVQFRTVNNDRQRSRQLDGRLEVLYLVINETFGPLYQRIPNVSGKTLVSPFLVNARWYRTSA